MVEYFGEQLSGFAFSANGWVQSYGSRCVKPPIIYGDVSRPKSMTVFWSTLAQSMTARPMKGMLTGPVTILNWSFVRNDQPRYRKQKEQDRENKIQKDVAFCWFIFHSFNLVYFFQFSDSRPATRLLWPLRMKWRISRRTVSLLSKLMRLL